MTARIAVARLLEMSWRAASEDQTSRKAEATTADPKTAIAERGASCTPSRRRRSAGSATARASAILSTGTYFIARVRTVRAQA